jgi:hypothetical protein
MRKLFELLREPFKKHTPLEMIAASLSDAHLSKLEAEAGVEYAQSIVAYNIARIERLNKRMEEYK